uniref:Tau95_N domain-containing protein n=1 Tax=Rhabditophanes sp. KR3021 TaxID=114890 RepID=A0AC35U887_9BILA
MAHLQGEVHINLPKYVSVEFPGIVKNANKALEMLGDPKRLETVKKGTISDRQELTSGENSQLLVKVRRNLRTQKQSLVVCGEVTTLYTFKVRTDFLVIPTEVPKTCKDIPKDLSGALFPRTSKEAYGRYGVPSLRMLCRELEDKEYEKFVTTKGHGTNMRTERKALSIVVQKDEQFPKEATKAAITEAEIGWKEYFQNLANYGFHVVINEVKKDINEIANQMDNQEITVL